jgi:hypothetical protein
MYLMGRKVAVQIGKKCDGCSSAFKKFHINGAFFNTVRERALE